MSHDIDLSNITEDQAHTLFHDLMRKFGWVGTVFTNGDVREAVDSGYEDMYGAEPTEEVSRGLVEDVTGMYGWEKMADRFAEVGNGILADLVHDALNEDD